jgi:hypothetical protein
MSTPQNGPATPGQLQDANAFQRIARSACRSILLSFSPNFYEFLPGADTLAYAMPPSIMFKRAFFRSGGVPYGNALYRHRRAANCSVKCL